MTTELLIVGLLSAGGAIGCGLARRHQAGRLGGLLEARGTSLEELQGLQAAVAAELGAGAFREQVKLSAEIVCAEPLRAPWSDEPCVAFVDTETELVEEYVETTSTDADGRSRREGSWQRCDQTLSQLERRCSFDLRQGGCSLPVNPEGAELELESVVDTTDRSGSDGDLGVGRGLADLVGGSTGRRSLGVRREEWILRAGGSVFVVAECSDAAGVLQLQAPGAGGLFVLRRGSEEQYSRSLRRWRRIWTLSTWGLVALTLLLLLLSVL